MSDKITVEVTYIPATGDRLFEDYTAPYYVARITEGYDNNPYPNALFGKGSTVEEAIDGLRRRRDGLANTVYAIHANRMKLIRNY